MSIKAVVLGFLSGVVVSYLFSIILFFIEQAGGFHSEEVYFLSLIPGVAAAFLAYKKFSKGKRTTFLDAAAAVARSAQVTKEKITSNVYEEENYDAYAIAEEEVVSGKYQKGLWSKALMIANGDENRRKAEYIRLRAKQIKNKNYNN